MERPSRQRIAPSNARRVSSPVRNSEKNNAAKAATQRLAQPMASQSPSNNNYGNHFLPPRSTSPLANKGYPPRSTSPLANKGYAKSTVNANARTARSPSPVLRKNVNGHASTPHSMASTVRMSTSPRPSPKALSNGANVKQIPPSPKAQSNVARVKQRPPKPPLQTVGDVQKEKRYPADLRHVKFQEIDNRREAATLHDKIDLLREEKENILYKLRHAEQKIKEQEAKARECEKKVALLGEGLSLEAHLLSKKEATLQQREDALEAEKRAMDLKYDKISALRLEAKTVRGKAIESVQQAKEAEAEANSLHLMMQRMILTQDEMEEVVLKRCWLARYWGLAVHHGIYSEIAAEKYEYWSSLAPLPLEVVISAGFKAKEEHLNNNNTLENGNGGAEEKGRVVCTLNDLSGDRNIESTLSVEKGLHELASLKIEDALVIAMAQHRKLNFGGVDESFLDSKVLANTPKFTEALGLTQEEVEDTQFKQAWLIYFWRRAKTHKVEEDIADERLQFWISRSNHYPTSHDVVDVQRGLIELQKLGIENQLWEASRNNISQEFTNQNVDGHLEAANVPA